jgi:iron(III) transport system ATP-binding protein
MADLIVKNLRRDFGTYKAVSDVNFVGKDSELITLLGPSGCGKSTTLWMIAGLDRPTAGTIYLGAEAIVDCSRNEYRPAESRDFGLVFQSYALWPHMTVRGNLEFPLKLRRLQKRERDKRIDEALGLVELDGQADKYPYQLSGGQQQRVALARTIVYRPRLLLLDEPLSNLDAKLRERARIWLRDLQRRLGVTTLYVTHDQGEALSMSDRILVMNKGRIVQDGTPEDIYQRPSDPFVASFVGSSNLLGGHVEPNSTGVRLDSVGHVNVSPPSGLSANAPVTATIRPERIRILQERETLGEGYLVCDAVVKSAAYLGSRYETTVNVGGQELRLEGAVPPLAGDIKIAIPDDGWSIFPQV